MLDAGGLSTEAMQPFVHWTNLSKTTFVLPPTRPDAGYRPGQEPVGSWLMFKPGNPRQRVEGSSGSRFGLLTPIDDLESSA
jgi:hypothetical protein